MQNLAPESYNSPDWADPQIKPHNDPDDPIWVSKHSSFIVGKSTALDLVIDWGQEAEHE